MVPEGWVVVAEAGAFVAGAAVGGSEVGDGCAATGVATAAAAGGSVGAAGSGVSDWPQADSANPTNPAANIAANVRFMYSVSRKFRRQRRR